MLPVALNFEDLIKALMTVLKKVVTYSHVVVVLSFAVVMELDTAFFEKLGNEPPTQPLHKKKKYLFSYMFIYIKKGGIMCSI